MNPSKPLATGRLALLFLALAAAGCRPPERTGWAGYAEGDFIYVAAPVSGTLRTLAVQAGQQVAADAPLFSLEADPEQAASAEAQARVRAAQALADDASKGKRNEEIAVVRAQLGQARAQAARADADWRRQKALVADDFVSQSRLDDATTARTQAHDQVAQLEASLKVAMLPARRDERASAQAQADAAREAERGQAWRLRQTQQSAPAAGVVSDTFWRAGEYVPAGQPVLSLLPPAARKARFYVPESELGGIALGQAVSLHCDGCGGAIAARISRIATQPEYTPPVIYSNTQRAELVFLVEARPVDEAGALKLHPGQPLDVSPASAGAK